jgi:glycine cleavage system regulatory protein
VTTIVLTAIGDDRPGLVEALAHVTAAHGANWDRSHMAQLAGKFAGIVELTVSIEKADALIEDLRDLNAHGLLSVTVERGSATGVADTGVPWRMHLVGQDRPGIVHAISQALAELHVSIEELETDVTSAPMSAESLFTADAVLRAPDDLDASSLQEVLERLANELMVDLDLYA